MLGRIKAALWAALAGAGLIALAFWQGMRKGRQSAALDEAEGYKDARDRMDEVDIGDDPAVLRDWLRDRGQR